MENFSNRFKQLRKEMKVEQKELSTATGISYSAIQKYETGLNVPKGVYAERLADYFGVSLKYLFCETDDRNDRYVDEAISIHDMRKPTTTGGLTIAQSLELAKTLIEVSKLHDDGKITDEEYSIMKNKILRG